jgi:hypothetical protein
VTRIDKVLTERDRDRLMSRIRRETAGMFRDVFPIDLLSAQAAGATAEGSGIGPARAALEALLGEAEGAPGDASGAPGEGRSVPATVLHLEDHAAGRARSLILPRRISAGRRPRRTSESGGSAL